MSAIEKIEQRLLVVEEWGDMPDVRISRREFEAALAEAWKMGREAGFDTGNEYGQGYEFPVSTDNPFEEES